MDRSLYTALAWARAGYGQAAATIKVTGGSHGFINQSTHIAPDMNSSAVRSLLDSISITSVS
jgi:hypothetical protein